MIISGPWKVAKTKSGELQIIARGGVKIATIARRNKKNAAAIKMLPELIAIAELNTREECLCDGGPYKCDRCVAKRVLRKAKKI